jgi:hypothetical protein
MPNQPVKGCDLVMNSAVILAAENRQLRLKFKRQKKKKAQGKGFIVTGGWFDY